MKYIPFITTISLLFLVLYITLFSSNGIIHKPHYKPGDCIAYERERESWEEKTKYYFSHKIVEVGKTNYRTLYWYGAGENSDYLAKNDIHSDQSIGYVDGGWIKINCETLEKE